MNSSPSLYIRAGTLFVIGTTAALLSTIPSLEWVALAGVVGTSGILAWLLIRQGRVITWLKDAFEPLQGQLPEQAVEHLVYAIRAAAGIEALIWLCDVAGLSRDEAKDIMMWSAQALLRSALAEASLNPTGLLSEKPRQAPGT